MPSYPQMKILRADAHTVYISWFLLTMSALLFFLPFLTGITVTEGALITCFGAFCAAVIFHVILALMHRCPSCGKHPTIQGFRTVHPASVGQARAEGWAGVVINVVRRRPFVCIHCGVCFSEE